MVQSHGVTDMPNELACCRGWVDSLSTDQIVAMLAVLTNDDVICVA